MENLTDFGKFLIANNLKQIDVCGVLGVTKQHISNLANGKSKLSPRMLEILTDHTEWDTSMLPSTKDLVDGYEKRGRKPYYYQSDTTPQDKPISVPTGELEGKIRELEQRLEVMTRERDALADQCEFLKKQIEIQNEMIKKLING